MNFDNYDLENIKNIRKMIKSDQLKKETNKEIPYMRLNEKGNNKKLNITKKSREKFAKILTMSLDEKNKEE